MIATSITSWEAGIPDIATRKIAQVNIMLLLWMGNLSSTSLTLHTCTNRNNIKREEENQEERRKRKWHRIAVKGGNIVELKRKANDAEIASMRAQNLAREREAECNRALSRFVY